ncbi:cell division protein FtsA [Qingshengfaniella alkalisoli]|uniref:Cell division protein FtsA n=1 Tax=Qingshengfaniella alkalisoli TaxID=2599296 RepID=A0A5B8J4I8_9RHOB|nr:cell division protein FtsA [Qingshengfaniella alkalisoli]QDY69447.1 cell division protein FtsA [Qingshengfaniella alkalisoli]
MTELYQSQRAMRQMRKAAMQRGVVAILDIGTAKVTCLILRFDGEARPKVDGVGSMAGQSRFRIIGAATTRARGMRSGEIDTMPEAERAVRTVVQAAQKMAQVRVDHAIVCFSGARPRSYGLLGQVDVAGHEVAGSDIANVLASCDMPDIGAHRTVMHAQPVNFALDGRSGLSDPRGQVGQHLTTDMHMLTVDQGCVQNILHCIKRCDLELAGLASSAYVSAISSMVEDEQKLGAACIDLGAGSTGISIFMRGHMIYGDTVRFGGGHITQDISKGLGIPLDMAERIKTVHGGVTATGRDDLEMIELRSETGDWEHDRREVSRSELIGIMRPRVEEILEEVRARLDAAGFDYLPSQKLVLTGGGSQIPGLPGLAQRVLGHQARLGRPLRVQGLPHAATGPGFSSAVGLCLFAANPQDEWWDFDIPADRLHPRPLRRAVKWFKENW